MNSACDIEPLFACLRRGYESGRLAHAYLLAGPVEGAGRALAERLLMLLYCQAAEGRPCGACRGCRQAGSHAHPSLLWLEPQQKSRTIVIEQIRRAQHHLALTAFGREWKSVVLLGADRTGGDAANTLLKTLEEPPPDSLFLLLTDTPEALLATVVSRCQTIVLPKGEEETAGEFGELVAGVFDIRGAGLLAGLARAHYLAGRLKELQARIEQEEQEAVEGAELEPDVRKDMERVAAARSAARYKGAVAGVIGLLQRWYRDALLRVCGVEPPGLPAGADAARLLALAKGLTYRQALGNIRTLDEMKSRLDRSISEGWVFERAFSTLSACNSPCSQESESRIKTA